MEVCDEGSARLGSVRGCQRLSRADCGSEFSGQVRDSSSVSRGQQSVSAADR